MKGLEKLLAGLTGFVAIAGVAATSATATSLSPELTYSAEQFAICEPRLMVGSFADEEKTDPLQKGKLKGNVVLTAVDGYVIDPRAGSYVFETKTIGIDKSGEPHITQRVGIGLPKQITLEGYSYRGRSSRIRTVSLEAVMAAYQIKGTFECFEALGLEAA